MDEFDDTNLRDDFDDGFGEVVLMDNGAMREIADTDLLRGDPSDSPYPDDFDEMVVRRAKARIGPNGEMLDDLSHLMLEQEKFRDDLAKLAPHRRINPESAYRGLLGGQATINPGEDVKEVVRWSGEDIEGCPVSIMLFPISVVPTSPPAATVVRPFARIEFGTRDGKAIAEVDIGRGKQLTLPASVVYIQVGLDTGSNLAFRLSSSIGFYTIVRTEPLTRTLYVDDLVGSTSTTLTIPAFASSLWFERSAVAAQIKLDFLDANGDIAYTRIIAANQYQNDPIRIANDIIQVTVTNNSAALTDGRAIFGLTL